jgi:hypothetical protein
VSQILLSKTQVEEKASHCAYCGEKLVLGYWWTCHTCGATYCFVHMTKHRNAHPSMLKSQ